MLNLGGRGHASPEKFLKMNAKVLQFYVVLVKEYAYIWHAILAAYNILAMHSYLR